MKLGLRRHANTHDPDKGSDPIAALANVIRYLVDNQGDWLDITTNDEIPSSDIGFRITVNGGKDLDISMVGGGDFKIHGGTSTIEKSTSTATLTSSGGVWRVETAGITGRLFAGKDFTLEDSSGNPILQMTEGSPDLHIPTGGNVVADL